jgi:hypothetical protein
MNKKFLTQVIITISKTSLLSIINITVFIQPSLAQFAASNALPVFSLSSLTKKNSISQIKLTKYSTTPRKSPQKRLSQNTPIPTVPEKPPETQEKLPINPPGTAVELLPEGTTRNYIGIGGNLGLSGNTALGESAFTVFSKIGVTNNLSFRPAAAISNQTVILLPITFDFPIEPSTTYFTEPQISFTPYIGGGAAISTGDNSSVGFLLTGGLDVRLSPEFTATAGLNVGFLDKTDVGLILGIGYNF